MVLFFYYYLFLKRLRAAKLEKVVCKDGTKRTEPSG